jgi:hypothetical protein
MADRRSLGQREIAAIDEAIREALEEEQVVLYDAGGQPLRREDAVYGEVADTVRDILTRTMGRQPRGGFETRHHAREAIHESIREVLGPAEKGFTYEFDVTSGKLVLKRPTQKGELKAEVKVYHVVAKLAGALGFTYWAMTKAELAAPTIAKTPPKLDDEAGLEWARAQVEKYYGPLFPLHFPHNQVFFRSTGHLVVDFCQTQGQIIPREHEFDRLRRLESACAKAGAEDVVRAYRESPARVIASWHPSKLPRPT